MAFLSLLYHLLLLLFCILLSLVLTFIIPFLLVSLNFFFLILTFEFNVGALIYFAFLKVSLFLIEG